ncbi:MAG TPA: hypothetical protein ENN21_00410 [Spirochaetes bacterium]|nr:hypothetical protein [Spirochaetota bacterium]
MNKFRGIRAALPAAMLVIALGGCSSGGTFHGASSENFLQGARILMKADPDTRFAVMDFTDAAGSFTAYGKIIGDETFHRLASLKGIQLIERRELDTVLAEHRMEQSGLVYSAAREKLGFILSVNILVTGSYAFEGDGIRVNGRYIDVWTGEIRSTFAYYLKTGRKKTGAVTRLEEEPESCEPWEKKIEPFMRDLRTPVKVERAAEAAVKIPFTMKCRHIHRGIMGTFARGGHYPERYVRFLSGTAAAIRDPEEVERKSSIFYYFQSDKIIDEREWNAGLLAMKNANERTVRRVVYFMLNRGEPQDEALLKKRIDILMGLAGAGAFGKPVPLSAGRMFLAILRMGPPNETTRLMRLYLLDHYAKGLPKERKYLSYILTYSEKSLISEKDKPSRLRFYDHIGGLFAVTDPEDKNDLALQLIRFTGEIHYRHGKDDEKELAAFSVKLAPWFCHAATQVRRDYRLRSAVGVLEKYNIRCDP